MMNAWGSQEYGWMGLTELAVVHWQGLPV
jgi:hypothetical protein